MNRSTQTKPSQTLSVWDVVALVVGVVIGASIFKTPALVAQNVSSSAAIFLVWGLGAGISLVGALCYAELASTYPHAGGDYHFLQRAFGERLSFLFAWARLAVIQTGSIALLAFVFGDYATEIFSLGPYSSALYAALAVGSLTLLNMAGVRPGKKTQQWLTATTVIGLTMIILVGVVYAVYSGPQEAAAASTAPEGQSSLGMAMVFVLLTYGGWNEAAYVSAELRNVGQNMVRSLLLSLGLIGALYILVNASYIWGLGFAGMNSSNAVAADFMRQTVGSTGAHALSLLIAVAALSSTNATIFTGARTSYALGNDFSMFSFLGRWHTRANTPANALLLQGGVVLMLLVMGAVTRQGFESMVDYTAPVFWFFFFLTGISLFILRRQEPNKERPYRVPLYPITPIVFCLAALYMLWSSLTYTGIGALVGVGVLLVGLPVLWFGHDTTPSDGNHPQV
jgi:amino acid transporter